MQTKKHRIFEIFNENKESDRLGRWLMFALMILIFFNVLASILETEKTLQQTWGRFFLAFEFFSMLVFSIEYNLRLWSCTASTHFKHPIYGRFRYALRPMMIIDFIVILPFYLNFLVPSLDLRSIFILRLFRIFRIFHFRPFLRSLQLFFSVFQKRKDDLVMTLTIVAVLVILAANAMYLAEGSKNPSLASVPQAMWWALITITTIGYGDVVPVTVVGKLVGSVVALLGICAFGLPIAIFGAGFINELEERKQRRLHQKKIAHEATASPSPEHPEKKASCPHCGKPL